MTKSKTKRKKGARPTKAQSLAQSQNESGWLWWLSVAILILIFFLRLIGTNDPINPTLVSNPKLIAALSPLIHTTLAATVAYGLYTVWSKSKRWPNWFLPGGFLLVTFIYLLSFNPQLVPNGDNAEYLINVKSIAQEGAAYRLDTPNETRNTLANVGLPLVLLPIFKIWGLSLLKMKSFLFILAIACFPLLFALFRRLEGKLLGGILALITFSSPFLVANSSTIMTESLYLFWSLSTIVAAMVYAESKKNQLYWGVLVLFLGAMTFLTRAPGLSVLLATIIYLLVQIPLSKKHLNNFGSLVREGSFQKFCGIALPLLIALIIWQIKLAADGIAHANIIGSINFAENIPNNFAALRSVWGQMLFSESAFRWFRLSPDHQLPISHIGFILVQLLCLLGLIVGMRQRQLPAIYTVLMLVVIILGSQTPQERVIARYLTILIPFLIYYFYLAIDFLVQLISGLTSVRNLKIFVHQIPLLILFQLFLVGMSGNHFNVRTISPVHNEYYDSFLTAAKWCGENLPKDAYVMSVKPRIVYVLSGLKGTSMATEKDKYDDNWAKNKLEEIKTKNISHIIVDALSITTTENIYPLLQNNPDRFEPIQVPGLDAKCTVVRVR